MTQASLRDQMLNRLEEVRARCPELRFGQLIATIAMLAEDETGDSLWDVEDGDFTAALERFAADMESRDSNRAEQRGGTDRNGVAAPPASLKYPEGV